MLELYVRGYVYMAIDIPPTAGRVGLTRAAATSGLRWWPMALPGGPFAEQALPVDPAALYTSRTAAPDGAKHRAVAGAGSAVTAAMPTAERSHATKKS